MQHNQPSSAQSAKRVSRARLTRHPRWVCLSLAFVLSLVVFEKAAKAAEPRATVDSQTIANPWIATVVGAAPDRQPERVGYAVSVPRSVDIAGTADRPSLFWHLDGLPFSLAAQDGPAPLVFSIAGTGVSHDGAQMQMLAKDLHAAGFHVVSLPSPTHPDFIATASTSGVPGILADDARDLYHAMIAIRLLLADEIEATAYHLMGYSLGATQAAFVAELDSRVGEIEFQRTLLINPAVNLYRSAALFDEIFAQRFPRGAQDVTAFLDRASAVIAAGDDASRSDTLSDDFLYEAYRRQELSEDLAVGAIALVFRVAAMSMTFAADLTSRAGVIIPADEELGAFESTTPYLEATAALDFDDYIQRILLPRVREVLPSADMQWVEQAADLRQIEAWLRETPDVATLTNHDDFILADADLAWLVAVFGERAVVWPHGGHLGNLSDHGHRAAIVGFLSRAELPSLSERLEPHAPRPRLRDTTPLTPSTAATDPQTMKPDTEALLLSASDPFEAGNRRLYGLNHLLDRYLFDPVLRVYDRVLPRLVRSSIHNFFLNIAHLGDIGNNLLQLQGRDAASSTGRLLVNSTLGIGGLADPATRLGLYRRQEDFGQTLGWAGVPAGPYLVLPLVGPTNVRDAIGRTIDTMTFQWVNPIGLAQTMGDMVWPYALQGLDERRSVPFRYYQTGSPFEYEAVRAIVLRMREGEILK